MRLGKITQAAWNRSVRKPLKKKQCTVGKIAWEQKCAELGQQIQKMEQSQKTEQDQKTEQGQRIGSGRMTVWSTASAGGKNANVGAYAVIKAAGELASQKVMAEGISIHVILPEQMQEVLARTEQVQYHASRYFNHSSVFFIGRNLDYALSLEGSLKLKEISYIHSEAYASGELKHGTISLIEPGTLVVALGTYEPLFDKAMSNVVEVQARGARVLALTTESHREAMLARTDRVLTVPEVEPMLLPQLGVAPLQLLAYYIALERGCDIDKPRNLAKSVTVE